MKKIRERVDTFLMINHTPLWLSNLHSFLLNPFAIACSIAILLFFLFFPIIPYEYKVYLSVIPIQISFEGGDSFSVVGIIFLLLLLFTLARFSFDKDIFLNFNFSERYYNFTSTTEFMIFNVLFFIRIFLLVVFLSFPIVSSFIFYQDLLINKPDVIKSDQYQKDIIKGYVFSQDTFDIKMHTAIYKDYSFLKKYYTIEEYIRSEKKEYEKYVKKKYGFNLASISNEEKSRVSAIYNKILSENYKYNLFDDKPYIVKTIDCIKTAKNFTDYVLKNYWAFIFLFSSSLSFGLIFLLKSPENEQILPSSMMFILLCMVIVFILISLNDLSQSNYKFILTTIGLFTLIFPLLLSLLSSNLTLFFLSCILTPLILPIMFFTFLWDLKDQNTDLSNFYTHLFGYGNFVVCLLFSILLKPKMNRLYFRRKE